MDSHSVQTKRWTRSEYYHMADAGVFQPSEHVELIHGAIITMTPQRSPHAAVIGKAAAALRAAFGEGYWVRTQLPLALSDDSEPEPDVSVVSGSPDDYLNDHPTTALLVVEVSDTTLSYDRRDKMSLYAQFGIPEYWILNLKINQLEVFRDPQASRYHTHSVFAVSETVKPLHMTAHSIAVSALLLPHQ